MARRHILITGPPRCGKSTLIERVVRQLDRPATGFFTRELRAGERRVGFAIETLDGKRGILAHQDLRSRYEVGRYGVNLADIEGIAVPSLFPSGPEELVVVDEIGKMECLSRVFRDTLIRVLNSSHPVLGSIALKGDHFIQGIKARNDVLLIGLSEANREEAFAVVVRELSGRSAA
ncbi:MAG: ATPase [Deltaproteobacteria bacterium]|nr:ATPase [Deltaproteobacteria bacterium]